MATQTSTQRQAAARRAAATRKRNAAGKLDLVRREFDRFERRGAQALARRPRIRRSA